MKGDRHLRHTQALEAHLGLAVDWDAIGRQLLTTHASWEQVTQVAQALIGPSGFTIFTKIEEGVLLRLAGKSRQVCQYLIGNPWASRAAVRVESRSRLVRALTTPGVRRSRTSIGGK